MLRNGPDHRGRPAPTDTSRRPKIVYTITADGKDHFAEAMHDAGPSAWDDDTFGVRFSFFGRTDPATRLRILEGRRARMEERLANVRAAMSRTAERVDHYTLELQRHGLESAEREVRWLNELIDGERRTQHRHHRSAPDPCETRTTPSTEGVPQWLRSELGSSASATAPRRWSRACTTTVTPRPTSACPV